ncbi:MAG: hypothetical protein RIQ41_222 [Candidatus Parcubacteria bacterium]
MKLAACGVWVGSVVGVVLDLDFAPGRNLEDALGHGFQIEIFRNDRLRQIVWNLVRPTGYCHFDDGGIVVRFGAGLELVVEVLLEPHEMLGRSRWFGEIKH